MKKILAKKDNSKRNQLILGIFLILIMSFSTIGYALSDRESKSTTKGKLTYGGIEFIKDSSEYWTFNTQGITFLTKYNPEEVKDINFKGNLILETLRNKPIYFVSETQEPIYEISRNIESVISRGQMACLEEENCSGDLPIKNCEQDKIFIVKEIKENEQNRVYQEGNCIFILADYSNQTRYADKVLFSLLGIN